MAVYGVQTTPCLGLTVAQPTVWHLHLLPHTKRKRASGYWCVRSSRRVAAVHWDQPSSRYSCCVCGHGIQPINAAAHIARCHPRWLHDLIASEMHWQMMYRLREPAQKSTVE